MKTMKRIFLALLIAGLFVSSSCNKDDDQVIQNGTTIVDIAGDNANFSTLVAALVKADLVSTLSNPGTFTVFAPTNDAFQSLFTELGVSGLNDLSAEVLKPILLYHVIGSEVKSADLTNGYVPSLLNSYDNSAVNLLVDLGSGVRINKSTSVITADIEASNGVIHVIDRVLSPPTVVNLAIDNPSFSILVEAVVKAELVETLSADGPFTVFAPTNDAFNALFADLGVSGIADLSKESLIPILKYHVVADNVLSSELTSGSVATLNGNITIALGTTPTINTNSEIAIVDVQGTNGVVHAITRVLLPPSK